MIGELFGNLLSCETCKHGIGSHDGAGCHVTRCDCRLSMQIVLEHNIATSTAEFQQQYRISI